MYNSDVLDFPPNFVFGSATAAYQIEGAARSGGRGKSIWDTFSHTPGRVRAGDTGDVACDHYHLWERDLDLMKELGLQAYRFSISWSRIMPSGTGKINQEGLDFYSRLVDGILARGIQPVATLYHWDLPQELEDNGGWPARETVVAFENYAAVLGAALGDRISTWTTLNEPWCTAFLGYSEGVHAPGRREPAAALAAVHHLNLAHGRALQALRSTVSGTPQYSVTLNPQIAVAETTADAEAVRRIDAVGNRCFTGPMLHGEYPADLLADTAHVTDWSVIQDGDLRDIQQPIDILGLNYYTTVRVRLRESKALDAIPDATTITVRNHIGSDIDAGSTWVGSSDLVEVLQPRKPVTGMGWAIEPGALAGYLGTIAKEFPDLPLMITENGAAFDDFVSDGTIQDSDRISYLHDHLTVVRQAIADGVNVRGYFVWSLLDNFEWAFGYSKRFGIVHVDFDSAELTRTPKASAHWYRKLIETRRIPSAS